MKCVKLLLMLSVSPLVKSRLSVKFWGVKSYMWTFVPLVPVFFKGQMQ